MFTLLAVVLARCLAEDFVHDSAWLPEVNEIAAHGPHVLVRAQGEKVDPAAFWGRIFAVRLQSLPSFVALTRIRRDRKVERCGCRARTFVLSLVQRLGQKCLQKPFVFLLEAFELVKLDIFKSLEVVAESGFDPDEGQEFLVERARLDSKQQRQSSLRGRGGEPCFVLVERIVSRLLVGFTRDNAQVVPVEGPRRGKGGEHLLTQLGYRGRVCTSLA